MEDATRNVFQQRKLKQNNNAKYKPKTANQAKKKMYVKRRCTHRTTKQKKKQYCNMLKRK